MAGIAADSLRAVALGEVLKALSNPARLRIVAALCERGENVNGLAARLGLGQAIVSQQLRILRMSGLVAVTRRGGYAQYTLAEPRLRQLVACLEQCHRVPAGSAGQPRGAARAARKGVTE
jgi:DNA-binding transcriptional ArsR family regulator